MLRKIRDFFKKLINIRNKWFGKNNINIKLKEIRELLKRRRIKIMDGMLNIRI